VPGYDLASVKLNTTWNWRNNSSSKYYFLIINYFRFNAQSHFCSSECDNTEFVFIKNGIFVKVLKYLFAFIIEKYNHILRKINTALRPIIQMLVKTILACFCTLKNVFVKLLKLQINVYRCLEQQNSTSYRNSSNRRQILMKLVDIKLKEIFYMNSSFISNVLNTNCWV
jgi:hypothetical protein